MFAVSAAADDAWLSTSGGFTGLGFEDANWCTTSYDDAYDEICDYCEYRLDVSTEIAALQSVRQRFVHARVLHVFQGPLR